jgi:hypothetical protein
MSKTPPPVLTIYGPIGPVNGVVPRTPELDGLPLEGLSGLTIEARVGGLTRVVLEFNAATVRIIESCEVRGGTEPTP